MRNLFFTFVLVATGCGGTQRSVATYRTDTQRVLATRDADIKRCYDEVLAKDPAAKGSVGVRFTVAHKTGAFSAAALVPEKSSAPEPVATCVVKALQGLALAPPDKNDGQATFVYELTPGS